MANRKRLLNLIILGAMLLGMITAAPAVQAQTTYDYAWLQETATLPYDEAIEAINVAWGSRNGNQWRSEGGAGTFDIPSHSVVIGAMNAGNDPAFEELASNIWYSPEGGRFGTSEGFRAFQLDGAVVALAASARPVSVAQMLELVAKQSEYGRKIATLDVEWSSNASVINRWGSSAWKELLTGEQQDMLKNNGQRPQPLKQLLPGNTVVWGELAPGNLHWGLRRISENIYITTGQGGLFVTDRGFRAMQFPR